MPNRLKILSMMVFSFISMMGMLFADLDTATVENRDEGADRIELDFEEKPDTLHPEVKNKIETLKEEAENNNIDITITSDFRSFDAQEALYSQGRSLPGEIVTNARGGESYHNYGLAIDYAIEVDGEVIWDVEYDGNDNGKSDWFEVADMAKDLGFEWGGDWESFKDYPHLEMDFGYSIRVLQKEYE